MPIDTAKLIDFLNEYLPAMDEQKVPTEINAGGCGFFAYNLSLVLDKMKVPHSIVALYYHDDAYFRKLKKYAVDQTVNINRVGVDHIVVKIDDQYIDAMGLVTNNPVTGNVPENRIELDEKIVPKILDTDIWSDAFDVSLKPVILEYLNDIPNKFKSWKKGTYKHKYVVEPLKELNEYSKMNSDTYHKELVWGLDKLRKEKRFQTQ